MKTTFTFLIALFGLISVSTAQTNISLLGKLEYNTILSDVWGYVHPSGTEYALVGLNNGVSIVDVSTDPTNPTQVQFVSWLSSTWYDMKTWGDYGYAINETTGGLLIMDLSGLPGAVTTSTWTNGGSYQTTHNLFIDENGIAYLVGSNVGIGGALIVDLATDPLNPTLLAQYNDQYIHDIYVRNDTMYNAEINAGVLRVVDATDKNNLQAIGSVSTPSNFTHNCWLSDDGKTIFTTDEVENAFIASYDISDPTDITELGRVQTAPGSNTIVHNTFFLNDYLITSYYTEGITIHDVTNPSAMIETGHYDTSPNFSGGGFDGAWGVYPYLPSGNILVSDRQEGLHVLQPDYQRAAFVSGTVTEMGSATPLHDVTVEVEGNETKTDLLGNYMAGSPTSGNVDITFTKPGYITKIENVLLTQGNTITLDVELEPLPTFFVIGSVKDDQGNGLSDAEVLLSNEDFSFSAITDGLGNYTIADVIIGTYDGVAGQWGYVSEHVSEIEVTEPAAADFTLVPGLYDDFELDFGWTASGTSELDGAWVREDPEGTDLGTGVFINPDIDSNDEGNLAYITGNDDDFNFVYNGTVILTSPTFDLTGIVNPVIELSTYYLNATATAGGGQNNYFRISLTDGISTVILEETTSVLDPTIQQVWQDKGFLVSSYITPGPNMQLIFQAHSASSGNEQTVLECGVDHFFVRDSPVGIEDVTNSLNISIYPNPSTDYFTVSLSEEMQEELSVADVQIELYNVTGQLVQSQKIETSETVIQRNDLYSGIYFLRLMSNGITLGQQKVIFE